MFRPSRSHRFVTSLAVAFAVAGLVPAEASLAADGAGLDLEGTWFVLIHYRDSMTANPDSDRWEDKVWTFEKKGSRLQWTEYPIVVFSDGSGRFGRVGGNPRARLLHKWEPNADQMAEIAFGPQVNSRGSKSKGLRGSAKRGFKSTGGSRTASAMTIGYQETWTIDDPAAKPVFTRDDALGAEAELATGGDVISGRTRYATLDVLDGGNVLQGTYARDENKRGSFRLIRAGAVRGLQTDGRTPNQKAQERQRENIRSAIQDGAYREFLKRLGNDRVRALRAQLGEDGLYAVWQKYEARIIGGDTSADEELGEALRKAYIDSLEDDAVAAIRDWDGDALARAQSEGATPKRIALLESLRDTLGQAKIDVLHSEYAERLKSGDEEADKAVRKEIRTAYERQMEEEFRARLDSLDPDAVREYKEMKRKEQDRR